MKVPLICLLACEEQTRSNNFLFNQVVKFTMFQPIRSADKWTRRRFISNGILSDENEFTCWPTPPWQPLPSALLTVRQSNQIKSNQIKSNQIKSNHLTVRQSVEWPASLPPVNTAVTLFTRGDTFERHF